MALSGRRQAMSIPNIGYVSAMRKALHVLASARPREESRRTTFTTSKFVESAQMLQATHAVQRVDRLGLSTSRNDPTLEKSWNMMHHLSLEARAPSYGPPGFAFVSTAQY